MAKIRVAVLFGGVSSEHDVSLISAENVIRSIPKDKYEVLCIGITKKGRWLYFPGDITEISTGAWESGLQRCDPVTGSAARRHHHHRERRDIH